MRARAMGRPRHAEEGQVFPALLGFGLAILAAGVLLFQVGRAADLRGRAQTAADAGALAAAESVRQQYAQAIHQCNCPNLGGISDGPAAAAAAAYAATNGAALEGFSRFALTVDVDVGTFDDVNDQEAAPIVGSANGNASARAQVFVNPGLWAVVASFSAAQQQVPVQVVLQFLSSRLVPDS